MITNECVQNWKQKTISHSEKILQNVISNNKLGNLSNVRNECTKFNAVYNIEVTPHLNVTNQKSSGRCWLFAALNVIRRYTCNKYNLDNFEFSQNYLFFWDKLERMNYNLECIIRTKQEDVNSQIVQHLLNDPTCDGGQWDMVVNLINKYGLVPKSIYQETHHSSNSSELNAILKKKFREYSFNLRSNENVQDLKREYLGEIYNILCKFLGSPPEKFNWEYIDKNKKYHKINNLTPLNFYNNYLNFKADDYVCLINDPRKEHQYNKLYTVKYLGNVFDGKKVKYINLPIERIKELTLTSLKKNDSVWFGCDVGKFLNKDNCALDIEQTDYLGLFNTSFNLNKEQRLNYRDSLMTHAMLFTGANIDESQNCLDNKIQINGWEVENSWSSHGPNNGYYYMSDMWFNEYVYEVAINKNLLNDDELEILSNEFEKELPPWDPMGALA